MVTNTSGKKKTAIARATVRDGTGKIRVNAQPVELFEPEMARLKMLEPFRVVERNVRDGVDIDISVEGGGTVGQADAVRTAIARGLVEHANDARAASPAEHAESAKLEGQFTTVEGEPLDLPADGLAGQRVAVAVEDALDDREFELLMEGAAELARSEYYYDADPEFIIYVLGRLGLLSRCGGGDHEQARSGSENVTAHGVPLTTRPTDHRWGRGFALLRDKNDSTVKLQGLSNFGMRVQILSFFGSYRTNILPKCRFATDRWLRSLDNSSASSIAAHQRPRPSFCRAPSFNRCRIQGSGSSSPISAY